MEGKNSTLSISNLHSKRIALLVQYDGTDFCGWQRQKIGISVQGVLEDAIASLDRDNQSKVVAAGRTDAGVHASGQVVHFDYSGFIPGERWTFALNGRLPDSIRIRDSVVRPSSWHACHSATYRKYRYTIYNARRQNLFLSKWCLHKYQFRLDEKLMNLAVQGLMGCHDFTAFQKLGSGRKNAITTIQYVHVFREGDIVTIEIQATGFLYGMVRLLVGQLIAIGEHKLTIEKFEERWQEKLRHEIKDSAPAKGLCLIEAGYQEQIFSDHNLLDGFPSFILKDSNSPPDP